MTRLLILDQDQAYVTRLYDYLVEAGYDVTTTDTMREACLMLAQQPHELALLGLFGGPALIRSLRSLQPDLRVILLPEHDQQEIPPEMKKQAQGVLARSQEKQVRGLVAGVLARPAGAPPANKNLLAEPAADTPTGPVSPAVLTVTLQQALAEPRVLAATLSRRDEVLAHAGTLNETQARSVAAQVWRHRPADGTGTALVTFVSLPGRVSEVLLYAAVIDPERLLTIVAQPDTAITPLRQTADRVAMALFPLLAPEAAPARSAPEAITLSTPYSPGKVNAYAVAWRSVAPVPPVLHIPIKRALTRIAHDNACLLNFHEVQPDYVHLVVTCPPGRDSAWVAHRFKYGTAQEIQGQFGIKAELWQPGYLAVASTKPLSSQELNLFLARPAEGEPA